MIDVDARAKMADLLSDLLDGKATIRAYDDAVWSIRSEDSAIKAIRSRLWTGYDDYFSGEKDIGSLAGETVLVMRRCVLFLRSNSPYRWSRRNFISIVALMRWFPPLARKLQRERQDGDWEAWPFFTQEELTSVGGSAA